MKNMKNTITKLFAGAALLSLVLAGCSSLKEDGGTVGKDQIKFSASIGSYQVKATDTAFENGDVIGLFADYPVDAQNVPITWNNGSLVPEAPVYWGSSQYVDESVAFYAYYPYDASNEGYIEKFTVQEDQTTHEAYTASDLMVARTLAAPAEGTVNLNFIHRMTKLVLHVENRLPDENVAAITVGNVYVTARGGFGADDEIHSTGEPGAVKAGKIVLEDGEVAWQAIIAPYQWVKPAILITTESGKEYVYNADYEVYFSPSRCYNAYVVIDETSVSTDFTSNITDWWDGAWFWFNQNVPSPYSGEWSIIGTVKGTNWDTDFQADEDREDVKYYRLAYREGQEFKFRMDGDWAVNFGGTENNTGNWQTMLQVEEVNALVQDGLNLMLPEDGWYDVYLNTANQTVKVYYAGELPSYEGIVVWDGEVYLNDWTWDERTNNLGSEPFWVLHNLEIGDEIRIYYDASDMVNSYWLFAAYDNQRKNLAGFDSWNYSDVTGYVSFTVTEEIYECLTSVEGWGAALIVQGEGNVKIVAVTLVKDGGGQTPSLDEIQPIVYAENDTYVELTQVVYAISSRGFVLYDGKYSIFVYTGANATIPEIGDIVHVSGTKTTYNNVPEISNPAYEVLGRETEIYDLYYQDVTSYLDEGFADIAIPISVEGVLSSDGYTLVVEDQVFNVSLYYPASYLDIAAFANHKLVVYGFYNGRRDSSSLVYLIPVSFEDYGEVETSEYVAEGDGSLENPYNATGVYQAVAALEANGTIENVYMKGVISSVKYTFSANYGTATFNISDDGSSEAPQFTAYSVYYFDGAAWQEGDLQVNVGDSVVLYGTVVNYKGTTPETSSKKAWIYELNGYRP